MTTNGRESNDVSAKGIKIGWVTKTGSGNRATVTGYAGKLRISGGTVIVNSTYGEGLEVKGDLTFEGGQTYVSSTAEDAINLLRDRVGAGHVAARFVSDKRKFIDEVRRERACELAFEGFRWQDLQRWLLCLRLFCRKRCNGLQRQHYFEWWLCDGSLYLWRSRGGY